MLLRFWFLAVTWNFLGTARMCKVWPGAVVAACIMFAWIIQHAFFGFRGLVFLISRGWFVKFWCGPVEVENLWLACMTCPCGVSSGDDDTGSCPSVSPVFSPVDFLKFCLLLSLPSPCPLIIPTQPLRIVRISVSFWNRFCHLYNNLYNNL